jgi:Ca-activated chloride channel family protein
MRSFTAALFILIANFVIAGPPEELKYEVEVQVVDLQVSVSDGKGNFITDLHPEDFLILEDKVREEVLDLNAAREPFSIGIVLDTSSSMERVWRTTRQCTEEFVSALLPQDQFFIMTFDDKLKLENDFGLASNKAFQLTDLRYGDRTRLFDAIISSIEKLSTAQYERRALFVISDGINTLGAGNEKTAEDLALRTKTIIYSLIVGGEEEPLNPLRILSIATGGTYFAMHKDLPFMRVAYKKIASDLAHRFTLYYRSHSDYTQPRKPHITVKMKNKDWSVQYQRAYYPKPND